jgi:hypothetical protein
MKLARPLIEGLKMMALFGAVALVVWTMPEPELLDARQVQGEAGPAEATAN